MGQKRSDLLQSEEQERAADHSGPLRDKPLPMQDTRMNRCSYIDAVKATDILRRLAAFQPHIAGTPPLGVDTETSDIDILCHAADADLFAETVWALFSGEDDFRMWQWTGNGWPLLASFRAHQWEFEIFGGREPVERQVGWRHYDAERRLLALGGLPFRQAVQKARASGLKTEPAFWSALAQNGDAYKGMFELCEWPDARLRQMLAEAGF